MDTEKSSGMNFATWMFLGITVLLFVGFILFLAYFGVLNPSGGGSPERCAFPVQLQCSEYLVNGSGKITEIEFTLKNSIGDIIITNYSVTGNLDTLDGICISTNNNLYVPNIQKITLNLTCTNAIASLGSDKKKYKIFVNYNAVGSSKSHSIQGEILARRES